MLALTTFDVVFLSVAGSLLFLIFVVFIASMVGLFAKRRQQQQLQLAQMKHEYAQMISQSQLEIQEQTFKNISQEIHDNIGQVLSLAKLQLDKPDDDNAAGTKADASGLLSNALHDLRSLSRSLHPDRIAGMPLVDSMAQELDMLQRSGKLTTTFTHSDDGAEPTPQQRIVLFRIFQEAMTNAIRHSEASNLQVSLQNDQRAISISISDDGKGFVAANSPGIGLTNIAQRAALIGAKASISSSPGKGTTVSITLPHITA